MSFESDKRFNDFKHFPVACVAVANSPWQKRTVWKIWHRDAGALSGQPGPRDDVESAFIEQGQIRRSRQQPRQVWFKYLKVIGPKRVHRLCTVAGGANEDAGGSFEGGGGGSDESLD